MTKSYFPENTKYSWHECSLNDHSLHNIQMRLQEVTRASFQSEVPFSHEDIAAAISISTSCHLLHNGDSMLPIGFAFTYETPFGEGERLCHINKIAIDHSHQGHGYASNFRELLLRNRYTWLSARTQNPAIMHTFSKSAGKVFPFGEEYSLNGGMKVLDFIQNNVPQIAEPPKDKPVSLQVSTGIFRGFYGHALGANFENKSASFICEADKLKSWQFDPEAGDAILIASHFNNLKNQQQ